MAFLDKVIEDHIMEAAADPEKAAKLITARRTFKMLSYLYDNVDDIRESLQRLQSRDFKDNMVELGYEKTDYKEMMVVVNDLVPLLKKLEGDLDDILPGIEMTAKDEK